MPTPPRPPASIVGGVGTKQGDLWCALAIGLALILWHLPAFTLIPAPNHDEIMLNAAARNWTARGSIALSPLAGPTNTYGQAYYWHPPAYTLLVAGAYKLFGFSIGVTRAVSLLSGAVAVALFYLLARRLGLPRWGALAAALLFAAHPLVWWLCRSGRMDLTAIACGLGSLLVLLRSDRARTSTATAVTAGLLLGVGSLFHIMILAWVPAVAVVEMLRVGSGRPRYLTAGLICAVVALPALLWVAHAFATGHGSAWNEQFLRYQLQQRSAAEPLWRRLPDELRLLCQQFKFVPLVLVAVGCGLAAGWRRTAGARPWLAAGAAVTFLGIGLICGKGTGAYPLYWYVWALLVAAFGLVSLGRRARFALLGLAVANAVVVQGAYAAIALYQRNARDPQRVDRFFAKHVKPGTIVVGPEDIWYAVEHAGAQLRIWVTPDPARHDYVVTYGNIPPQAPPGFRLEAELPDTMPKVRGHYFSVTAFSYRLWAAERAAIPAGTAVSRCP